MIAASIVALVPMAANAVVVNGDFETVDDRFGINDTTAGLDTLCNGTGNASWDVFTTIPGWTSSSGPGIEIQTTNTLTTIDPRSPCHYVELDSNANSAMYQDVMLDIGTYELSFWYSPRNNTVASNVIDYSLGTEVLPASILDGTVTGPGSTPPTSVGEWTEISRIFNVTTGGTFRLSFAASGTNNSLGGFIDDVAINVVPVPAAGLLLLGGFGALAAMKRRRKSA